MSSILFAIRESFLHPRPKGQHVVAPGGDHLVMVPGLSEEEQVFVRENRGQLGSGNAKKTADYSYSWWVMFRKLPFVVQMLAVVLLLVIIIIVPFVVQYAKMAVQSHDNGTRTILSMIVFTVLAVTIVMVMVLL